MRKSTIATSLVLMVSLFFNFAAPSLVRYSVETQKSKMRWTGYYLFSFGEHNGSIALTGGSLDVENQQIVKGYFDIDMKSIKDLDMPYDDGGKDLTEHLRSDDFFSVDKFPTARFEITKTEKIQDSKSGYPNFDITGELTLKGKKNTITFPAIIAFDDKGLTAKAKFKFDRTKWDIRYSSGKFFSDVGDGAISDAIAIDIDLVAVQ